MSKVYKLLTGIWIHYVYVDTVFFKMYLLVIYKIK